MVLAIFLVEDDWRIQEHFKLLVGEVLGAQVVGVAETSDEALAWIAANDGLWNLMVLDLCLRQGTGFQVLEHMEAVHKRQCVVLTNSPSAPNVAHCLALGVEAVFDKSLHIEDFLDYCALLTKSHQLNFRRAD